MSASLNPALPAVVAGAYLLGAVPFGVLVARSFAKVDVREGGSGNIGATNVARVAGKKLGVLTLALDALKGLVPTLAMALWVAPLAPAAQRPYWIAGTGLAAFLGHCYPVYLKFRGGKGVATALGVLLALAPWAALAGFALYALVYVTLRISSVGSLLAAATVPVVVFYTAGRVTGYFVLGMVAVVVWKHRGNIKRILSRTEGRI